MKRILLTLAALTLGMAAQAQSSTADHAAHHTTAAAKAEPITEGEVRKVDRAQGKVTLKHGRIENLDMPAMTMVFRATDPRLLDQLKPGDKVRFAAENINGALTVTAIQASP
jgi:Cu/Ag efflux protein CusF